MFWTSVRHVLPRQLSIPIRYDLDRLLTTYCWHHNMSAQAHKAVISQNYVPNTNSHEIRNYRLKNEGIRSHRFVISCAIIQRMRYTICMSIDLLFFRWKSHICENSITFLEIHISFPSKCVALIRYSSVECLKFTKYGWSNSL